MRMHIMTIFGATFIISNQNPFWKKSLILASMTANLFTEVAPTLYESEANIL